MRNLTDAGELVRTRFDADKVATKIKLEAATPAEQQHALAILYARSMGYSDMQRIAAILNLNPRDVQELSLELITSA